MVDLEGLGGGVGGVKWGGDGVGWGGVGGWVGWGRVE